MKKIFRASLFLFVLLLCLPGMSAPLPSPPQQHAVWVPPHTTLPAWLVEQAATLFAEGMADPRGCAYGEISVPADDGAATPGAVKTHGWVLPATAGETARYAVCWNGVEYPVLAVGPAADITADVQALVQAEAEQRATRRKAYPEQPFTRFGHEGSGNNISDVAGVQPDVMSPVKVCLLLRLGETALAAQCGAAWMAGLPEHISANDLSGITGWVGAVFDQAVTDHASGNDRRSLAYALSLPLFQAWVDTAATAEKLPRPGHTDPQERRAVNAPYFDFLAQLPVLIADEVRRVQHPHPASFSMRELQTITDKKQRIAALIDALDEVTGREVVMSFGADSPWDAPVMPGLLATGEDAVSPLLAVYPVEQRLTRRVSWNPEWALCPSRVARLIPVSDMESYLLQRLLGCEEMNPLLTLSQAELAARYRDYWQKNRGLTREDRCYATLMDDHATAEQWAVAAVHVGGVFGGAGTLGRQIPPAGDTLKPMDGPLRAKHHPGVSELLARRISELLNIPDEGTTPDPHLDAALTLTIALLRWDGGAASMLPALKTLSARYQQHIAAYQMVQVANDMSRQNYVEIILLRAFYHDHAALTEYAAWLRSALYANFSEISPALFQPLHDYADDPAMRSAADWLFTDAASPLKQQPDRLLRANGLQDMLKSSWLGSASFRAYVIGLLQDTTEQATFVMTPSGQIQWTEKENGSSFYAPSTKDATRLPKPNVVQHYRCCDEIAQELSRVEGMPNFETYWTDDARNKAISTCIDILRRYGDHPQPLSAIPPTGPCKLPHKV